MGTQVSGGTRGQSSVATDAPAAGFFSGLFNRSNSGSGSGSASQSGSGSASGSGSRSGSGSGSGSGSKNFFKQILSI